MVELISKVDTASDVNKKTKLNHKHFNPTVKFKTRSFLFQIVFFRDLQFSGETVPDKMTIFIK